MNRSINSLRPLLRTSAPSSRLINPSSVAPKSRLLPASPARNAWRSYSDAPKPSSPSGLSSQHFLIGGAAAVFIGGSYYFLTNSSGAPSGTNAKTDPTKTPLDNARKSVGDYQAVYNAIADQLEHDPEYDDGSFGPVLVRLAWHASGTYDDKSKTGGSNGATMRFAPEAGHGANAGLHHAREYMDKVKSQYPWISYSDLWTLGGVCAIQELGGPKINWRPGRTDREVEHTPPEGRLPDGAQAQDHLRFIFYRMGFNDQEIVALAGAHALGRCHTDRSGFEGAWQHAPLSFTNAYYTGLIDEKWIPRKWGGPGQFTDATTKTLMMLPADMALIKDKSFKPHVVRYAKDEGVFFNEFSDVFGKLLELGVPSFSHDAMQFQTTAEQENAKGK